MLIAQAANPLVLVLLVFLKIISTDFALSVIGATFAIALVPTVIKCWLTKHSGMNKQTTVMTGFGLLAMAILFFSLGLILAALTASVTSALWMVLLYQAFKYSRGVESDTMGSDALMNLVGTLQGLIAKPDKNADDKTEEEN